MENKTIQKGVSLVKKHIFEDIILQNALNFTKEVVEIFGDLLKVSCIIKCNR